MTMRNPAMAVLWESWRLSRLRLVVGVFLATLGGAALIVSPVDAAESATFALMLAGFTAYFSLWWTVNPDSRRGFSMTLGFARPIPTWVLVSVPMAYVGITCAATYLVSVLILRAAFGISFPLLPVAALVGTLSLAGVAFNWCRPGNAVGWAVALVIGLLSLYFGNPFVANNLVPLPDRWLELFAFSAWAYGWMALIAVAATGVTVAAVARQRRGDDGFTLTMPAGRSADALARAAFRAWFANRLRVPCPTASPTRAQLWLEVYTGGARVLGMGILSVMGFTLVVQIASTKYGGYFWANMALIVGLFLPLIAGSRLLLGVRRTQGTTYLSPFDATRPITTARLIGLKVAVTSFAILLSWAAVGTAFWTLPTDFMGLGTKPDIDVEHLVTAPLDLAMLILIPLVYAVTLMAYVGAVHALFLRNRRQVIVGAQVFGIYLVGMIYALATGRVPGSAILVQVAAVTAVGALVTLYLCRRALSERIFGTRGLIAVLALGAAVGAGIVFFPGRWGGPGGELTAVSILLVALIVLLPLLAMVLAPWSFAGIRHR